MKILVVEDNPQVAETIMDYLELAGHRLDHRPGHQAKAGPGIQRGAGA